MQMIILRVLSLAIAIACGTSRWTPDPFCPYPSTEIIYYPDPVDCSKYIECFDGNKYTRQCPIGLNWHQEITECDYPKNVNCTEYSTTTTPTTTTTETTTDTPITTTEYTTTDTPITTTDDPWVDEPECLAFAANTHIADCTNCSAYWVCLGSKRIQRHCSGDLWFNRELETCDYQNDANCNSDVPKPTISPNDERCKNGDCFLPNPEDCRKYIQCSRGTAYDKSCDKGQIFVSSRTACVNPKPNYCDKTKICFV